MAQQKKSMQLHHDLLRILPVNREHYIDLELPKSSDLRQIFQSANSYYLPLVKKKKAVGIVSFNHIDSGPDFEIEKIITSPITADLVNVDIGDQPLVVLVDEKGDYTGFLELGALELLKEINVLLNNLISEYEQQILDYKNTEEEIDAIFEASHDVIQVMDGDGFSLKISKACEQIEGIQPAEVVGKHISELIEAGTYDRSIFVEVLKQNKPVSMIQHTKYGKEVLATATPIYKNGKIFRVITNSRDVTELNTIKRQLLETKRIAEKLKFETEYLRTKQIQIPGVIIENEQMKQIVQLAFQVAKVDSTVLLRGESGVGKEVIAKLIHSYSHREKEAFIKIDCGAIPEALLESELFGYEKGAFTGASREGKMGMIELAHNGTLFLDEIGVLPLILQVKLLRVLQDHEIVHIGGKEPIHVDIRVIAATNHDLDKRVEDGLFRQDLFYRLNVIPIKIPPLRERREDIEPLIRYFMEEICDTYDLNKKMSPSVLRVLINYRWPGNVRELKNIVERMVVTSTGHLIGLQEVPQLCFDVHYLVEPVSQLSFKDSSLKKLVEDYEKKVLLALMSKLKNIKELTAVLKIDRGTVRRKFKRYGIEKRFRKI